MLKKDITFIYLDATERLIMELIENEAKKRGYRTRVTDDIYAKCEIGVYCEHVNFPQYSRFSVIMLHDIIQQYANWPDIWFREPWNKYDIGILPSNQWVENWNQCSQWFYARPRMGVYKVGWPKADTVANIDVTKYRDEFYKKYGLDKYKRTVLYAPAWENDGKQDDFVQSMLKLKVNILIKQYAPNPQNYPQSVLNIKQMELLHRNIPQVTILPPKSNIFDAILASDILVSEESSTMAEAAMLGVPAVSVSNWLIPDTVPSRYPKCNYDFVEMTTKEKLTECVSEILENYELYKGKTEEYAKNNFSNIGNSCSMIMDIIDDAVLGNKIRYDAVKPKSDQKVPLRKNIQFKVLRTKREIYFNYCQRNALLMGLWKCMRFIKNLIKH